MMTAKSPRGSQRKGREAEREVLQLEWGAMDRDWPYTPHSRPDDGYQPPPELAGYHQEIKRQEHISIWRAIRQAESEAAGRVPVVVFRRSRGEWMACMPMKHWLKLVLWIGLWRKKAWNRHV
jgi:hypothetical protein